MDTRKYQFITLIQTAFLANVGKGKLENNPGFIHGWMRDAFGAYDRMPGSLSDTEDISDAAVAYFCWRLYDELPKNKYGWFFLS